ncbi:MAG TPA: hypothetical protein VIH40_04965 [Xanthobacteraceae bacterium]
MARLILILAAIVDLLLAGLLVAVSGFVLGSGPESIRATGWVAAGWIAMLAFSIVAPVAGFALHSFGRPAGGILVAWLPPAVALIAVSLPPTF